MDLFNATSCSGSGFFEVLGCAMGQQAKEFSAWIAGNIMPGLLTLMGAGVTIWVFFYGYSVIRGEAQDPVHMFVWKVFRITAVASIVTGASIYTPWFIDTAWATQDQLVDLITGSSSGGLFKVLDSSFAPFWGFILTGVLYIVSISTDAVGVNTMFAFLLLFVVVMGGGVFALAFCYGLLGKIGLAIVVGLGPLFIAGLAFQPTTKFFDAWLNKFLNYIVLMGISALMVAFVTSAQTYALSQLMTTFNILYSGILLIIFAIALLMLMVEVPSMAATLTGGAPIGSIVTSYVTNKLAYGGLLPQGHEKPARMDKLAMNDAAKASGLSVPAYQRKLAQDKFPVIPPQ